MQESAVTCGDVRRGSEERCDTRAATCRAHAHSPRRAGHFAARNETTVSVNQNGERDDGLWGLAARFDRARVSLNGTRAIMRSTWLAATLAIAKSKGSSRIFQRSAQTHRPDIYVRPAAVQREQTPNTLPASLSRTIDVRGDIGRQISLRLIVSVKYRLSFIELTGLANLLNLNLPRLNSFGESCVTGWLICVNTLPAINVT